MKANKIIGFIIIMLIICLITIVVFIVNLTMLDTSEKEPNVQLTDENVNTNSGINKISSDYEHTNSNSTKAINEINSSTNSNVTKSENISNETSIEPDEEADWGETGEQEDSSELINKLEFQLKGIDNDEISNKIKNKDELNLKVKEFVFKNGLVDATKGELEKYEYQESTKRFGMVFVLNNPKKDKIRIIIDSKDNITVSKYE